jgi:hypothetical protein
MPSPSADRPDLPLKWVERIFQKLSLVYGREFLSRWEGQELPSVMADWSRELSGFADQPDAIAYGLQHLPPEKPPTVLQFRALCNLRPDKALPALPAPESKPAPEVMARVATILDTRRVNDHKAWAWKLRERESRGPGLTRAQRGMWRKALADELAAEGVELRAA